ncbi:DUF6011 domain-containing protein [Mycolicibacterium fortuitum]
MNRPPESKPHADQAEWRISVRCAVCGHWLTHPNSVRAGVGPKCGGDER